MKYSVFETAMGWVGVSASGKGLTAVTLPQKTREEAFRQLSLEGDAHQETGSLGETAGRLKDYFNGKNVKFPDRLDLSGVTPFQARVYEEAVGIPYGETRSYGWLAERVGRPKGARAVGQALGKNPIPIIVP